jgi:hypothetical protein
MLGIFSCGIHKQKTKTKKVRKKNAKQREKKRKEHSNEETNRISYNRRVGSLNRHSSSTISATTSKQKKKKKKNQKRREQQQRRASERGACAKTAPRAKALCFCLMENSIFKRLFTKNFAKCLSII